MKKGGRYWEKIDMLLEGEEHVGAQQARYDKHDSEIDKHISREISQTAVSVDEIVVGVKSLATHPQSRWTNLKNRVRESVVSNWIRSAQPGYSLAIMCVIIFSMYLLLSSHSPQNNKYFGLPESAVAISTVATGYINHSRENYGLVSSQPSEVFKAFLSGVVSTDEEIYALAGDQSAEKLYQMYIQKISEDADIALAKDIFAQAVERYSSGTADGAVEQSDRLKRWFEFGRVLEYVFLTASVATESYEDETLREALLEYVRVTGDVGMKSQREKFLEQHRKLAKAALLTTLSPDDIERVQDYAGNMKLLVQ